MGELLPNLSKVAHKMTVVRSIVGNIPDHGLYNMITGQKPSQAIKHPSVGAVVNHEFGRMVEFTGQVLDI